MVFVTRDVRYETREEEDRRLDLHAPENLRYDNSSEDVRASASGRIGRGNEIQPSPPVKRIKQHLTTSPLHLRQKSTEVERKRPSLPPLPSALSAPSRAYGALISFVLCVLIPVVFAAVYYVSIASDQYVSEFRFTVKDTSTANAGMGGVLAMMGGTPMGVGTENYLVTDYLSSRQAVEDLQKRIGLIGLYTKPNIDWLSRFDASKPMERFERYWKKMVHTTFDQVTGIATAQVYAFTPQDALLIATTMMALSEELVNQMSIRARRDAVRFAEKEVEKAQDRLRRVRGQLTENQQGRVPVNDPNSGAMLLDLERQVSQNMLASTMQQLDQARAAAAVQQLYITPYVRPSLPQSSIYPRAFVAIGLFTALAFGLWLIGLLVVRSIFERSA